MKLKDVIKIENKAKEVWVISPELHFDTEDKSFSELVSVNLGEKTKYRYIVPTTKQVLKNLEVYKKSFKVSEEEIQTMFLFLPETELIPFMSELAIYDASSKCCAFTAPSTDDASDVIQLSSHAAKKYAKEFKSIWKKYKRKNP